MLFILMFDKAAFSDSREKNIFTHEKMRWVFCVVWIETELFMEVKEKMNIYLQKLAFT